MVGTIRQIVRQVFQHFKPGFDLRTGLLELVEMAKRGQIQIKTTTYPIEDGEQAYADMHAGKIIGRAVVVP